jgi:hypothetical protein
MDQLKAVGGFAILAHVELAGSFETNLPRLTRPKLCHPALLGFEVTRADCPILYSGDDTDNDREAVLKQRIDRLKLGSHQIGRTAFYRYSPRIVSVSSGIMPERRRQPV